MTPPRLAAFSPDHHLVLGQSMWRSSRLFDPSPRMWGCLSLARRCDCRQPWSAARRREMDRCTAWCRLPTRHRRLLIHLMNQHRRRRSSVCRNMCVTADLQVLGSFGDGDVGVVSTQLQQRLSVDTNGLCATLREVLGDDRYESLTAIPRPPADEIAAAEQEAKASGRGLWGPLGFGETTSVAS